MQPVPDAPQEEAVQRLVGVNAPCVTSPRRWLRVSALARRLTRLHVEYPWGVLCCDSVTHEDVGEVSWAMYFQPVEQVHMEGVQVAK